MIGVGAGQQSRVDCAKLAANKVKNWYLRFHPKISKEMKFKPNTKKVDKTNARIHFIENSLSRADTDLFTNAQGPEPLSENEKDQWMKTLSGNLSIHLWVINHLLFVSRISGSTFVIQYSPINLFSPLFSSPPLCL